jgi:hypothetical protein
MVYKTNTRPHILIMNKRMWKERGYDTEINTLKELIKINTKDIKKLRKRFFALPNNYVSSRIAERLLEEINELKQDNENYKQEINTIYNMAAF